MKSGYIYLILGCLLFADTSKGQITVIPDSAFEQTLINLGHDNALDGGVLTANVDSILSLDIKYSDIEDLTGIQDFTDLGFLDCGGNSLTSLDITNNIALTDLRCYANSLTSLDISQSTALTTLYCGNNSITNLDLTQNIGLNQIYCSGNQLTGLDVSSLTSIEHLYCNTNQLSTLDLSQNVALYHLSVGNNLLSILDLTQNTDLEWLLCENNQLNTLDLSFTTKLDRLLCSGNQLNSLDISLHGSIYEFECHDNQLTCLNMQNGFNWNLWYFNATGNPDLVCIEVDSVSYASNTWTYANGNIDANSSFSTDCGNACSTTSIHDVQPLPKRLVLITDILGRNIQIERNRVLIYHYEDGSVEKRIVID